MKTNNNIPAYRFQGYTDAWEQRKLGEVADFSVKTNSLSRDKLSSYFYEVQNIHYGDILTKYDVILNVSNEELPSIIESKVSNFEDALLVEGDIVFADAAEDSTVGKAIEVRNLKGKNVVSGLHTIVARPKFSYAPYYLGYLINSTAYHNQILPLMQGTKVSSISKANLKLTTVAFPTLPEQEAIGSFFSDLDQLITLHQRKLDTLKEQKKTYLKLLFPAKEQTKPALRFQGFEDDWEEVKLGEVVSISSGYTGDATLNNGKYKLTRIETISEGKVDVSRTGFSNELPDEKYRLNFGDILFSNINSLVHIGKVAIFNTMEEVFHGINLLRLVPNKDLINPYFIYYQLVTESKKNWSKAHANQAVNQASINQTSLSTQKISFPTLPEQEAIGTFFQTLDQEIAQVEDKLASLKEMKKTLLRKLFV
ncbi:TPA: restriction endonuclease subunit S [Streptococcus suis]